MHFLVTRPEPEAADFAAALRTHGHEVSVAPLLTIRPLAPPIDLTGVQALIATSRNAVRAAQMHPERVRLVEVPLFAVGAATGRAAREAGFRTVVEGAGDATALAGIVRTALDPEAGALLHLAGDVTSVDLCAMLVEAGFECRTLVVYATEAATCLPEPVEKLIKQGALDAIVLMSPRTSRVLVALANAQGLGDEILRLHFLCLSDAVAEPLRARGAPHVLVAKKPNSEEILALVDHLSSTSAI